MPLTQTVGLRGENLSQLKGEDEWEHSRKREVGMRETGWGRETSRRIYS